MLILIIDDHILKDIFCF